MMQGILTDSDVARKVLAQGLDPNMELVRARIQCAVHGCVAAHSLAPTPTRPKSSRCAP